MSQYKLVVYFILIVPIVSYAQNLQQHWQTFYQKSWQSQSLIVTQQQLSRYPRILLRESARYPDFQKYTWQDLEQLDQISQNCLVETELVSRLQDAAEFELALCENRSLDESWFATRNPLHPFGGSFADRYLVANPAIKPSSAFYHSLSISNQQHPLYQRLSALSAEGREALLDGYRAWIENETLWLSGEQGWKAINIEIWNIFAQQLNITLLGGNCEFRYSNLCISKTTDNTLYLQILISGLLALILFLTLKGLYVRQQQSKEKRFILQLLTHELRTPITSLGITVEMLRHQFDFLPSHSQDAVWRLMSDYQRLSQLTENSKAYLGSSRMEPLLKQRHSIADWLGHVCEKHDVTFQLSCDVELNLSFYWLSICLDNLIKNAKQHGNGEISVKVTLMTRKLIVEVKDGGEFPSVFKRFVQRFNREKSNENMGVGLSIVRHLMRLMGGELKISRHPTRCILEISL